MDRVTVIDRTRRWIADVVIALNLCPFARRVFDGSAIRYAVTDAADDTALLEALASELATLAATPIETIETTLLIHPHALADFLDYNDFLADADRLVTRLGLRGIVQIASFHPHYQFAETKPDAVENYTNRSPFPMLHLLREESVTRVADDADELLEIPRRNVATLRRLGLDAMRAKLAEIARHDERPA